MALVVSKMAAIALFIVNHLHPPLPPSGQPSWLPLHIVETGEVSRSPPESDFLSSGPASGDSVSSSGITLYFISI